MKFFAYFLIGGFFFFPILSLATEANILCSSSGYTIATINGIFTDDNSAKQNMRVLKDKVGEIYQDQGIDYQYLLNPPHLAGIGDILKSIQQGLFDSETVEDYDLIEILQDASEKVSTQKLLLIAHSQGNFYANSFYDIVAGKEGGVPTESIGVYSVATPSGRVAGGGRWITSDTDKVIAGVVGHIPFRKIMEPNAHIELQNGDDPLGHNFSDIYLKYQSDKIISDIEFSLDRLKTNNIQDARKSCLASPKISIMHKIEGAAFAVADPVASGMFFLAFKLPVAVVDAGVEKVVEIAQAVKEAFAGVFQKDQFQLAQVIDLAQETQSDQPNQTSHPSNFKQCNFVTSQLPSRSKVIINEVAWMGGISSANDEWIELKNISGSPLDISDYQLLDKAEQIKIVFDKNTVIPAGGFFILERNGDEAVSSVKADRIYTGALSNTDEGLRLFDGGCNLVDEVLANSNWPAGDNTAKKTMERDLAGFGWHTSGIAGGTPKKANSQIIVEKPQTIFEEDEEENEGQNLNQPISTSTIIQEQDSLNQNTSQACGFNANQSPNHQKIIINEVAWMGTNNNSNDEWIELKNISGIELNLSGYQLIDQGEQIKIIFDSSDKILANGFYLIERTDDDAVPNIVADKIYTGALSNTEDGLRLFDDQCNLIDEVLANSGSDGKQWLAGDNTYKQTMERKSDLNWQTSANAGGTPKAANSSGYVISSGGGGGGSVNSQQQTANSQPQAPAKILINEIKISPTSERFIELYNPNDQAVSLTGWYLQRKTQSGSDFNSLVSKTNFEGKTINPKDYFVISRSTSTNSDLTINDLTLTEANTIQLKNSNQEVADKVGWGNVADFEGLGSAVSPGENQSIQRKFQDDAFIDTDDNAQDFEIQNYPSPGGQSQTCQQSQAPTKSAGVNHIVISEIYPDKTGNNFDFVELYNPTDSLIELNDYSLKKINEGATTTNPLASFSAEQAIAAKGFFLVGLDCYGESIGTAADTFHSSYFLPTTKIATIILYNKDDSVDEFNYNPANLETGQSFERKAFSGGVCVSSQNNGEFLGNGCDTDGGDDFEVQQTPNPQNSSNFPEPRNAPTAPENFDIQYSSSTMSLVFNWESSQDYSGATSSLTYKIFEITDATSTVITTTTSTTFIKSINEIGRDYEFSLQAFDEEGLGSATSAVSVAVPSLFSNLYFYQNPESGSSSPEYLVDLYYDNYPFIPQKYNSRLSGLVFYLNQENPPAPQSISLGSLSACLYGYADMENAMRIYYPAYALSQSGGNIVVLPNVLSPEDLYNQIYGGLPGGVYQYIINREQLEDNHLKISVRENFEKPLTVQDYFKIAFYSYTTDRAGCEQILVAVDQTKYYFTDSFPAHQPPQLTGQINLNFDKQNSRINLEWLKATDSDTLDYLLTYEIKYNDAEEWQPLGVNNVSRLVVPGDDFSISVRAKDEFDNYSETLTISWRYAEMETFINQSAVSDWSPVFGQWDGLNTANVSSQSIIPETDFQFDIILLRIRQNQAYSSSDLRLSVYSDNGANQPDFNNKLGESAISGVFEPDENDMAFNFVNPISLTANNKYWLTLEAENYDYHAWFRNSWQNAVANGDIYKNGEFAKFSRYSAGEYGGLSIDSDKDWYLKIGMGKSE